MSLDKISDSSMSHGEQPRDLDMSDFEKGMIMYEAPGAIVRDNLSDMLQNMAGFALFADMVNRNGGEFDEV